MTRPRLSRIVSVLALTSLVACGADGPRDDEPPFATYDRGSPSDAMNASALEGTLVLEDGCLYLQAGERWLPVFPNDVNWDGPTQTLQDPPWEASVRVGEQVRLGGGSVPYQPNVHAVPDSCDLPSDASDQASEVWVVGMVVPSDA